MPASASTEVRSDVRAPDTPSPARRRARKKTPPRRWVREVQGIAAITAGVFILVALAVFDPATAPGAQTTMVGPVGIWVAWGFFRAFGYAAFLFPLSAGVLGTAAFVRPLAARGWVPVAGLLLLLLAATGLLQQSTDSLAAARVTRGGIIRAGGFTGWAAAVALHASIGNAGTWLVLLTALPVSALLVTQTSYAAVTRLVSARLAHRRRRAGVGGQAEHGAAARPRRRDRGTRAAAAHHRGAGAAQEHAHREGPLVAGDVRFRQGWRRSVSAAAGRLAAGAVDRGAQAHA